MSSQVGVTCTELSSLGPLSALSAEGPQNHYFLCVGGVGWGQLLFDIFETVLQQLTFGFILAHI